MQLIHVTFIAVKLLEFIGIHINHAYYLTGICNVQRGREQETSDRKHFHVSSN